MTTTLFCEKCAKRYSRMNVHEAAKILSAGGTLPHCPDCDNVLIIKIRQQYPLERSAGTFHEYIVDKVTRAYSDELADQQKPPFDPMMFFLHEEGTERQFLWPIYWTKDEKGRWAWGQYSPMMTPDELRKLTE